MEENRIPFGAPLNALDTPSSTFGCRQNNPDICKFNGVEAVCAFARKDKMCMHPSRAWKNQYERLLEGKNE